MNICNRMFEKDAQGYSRCRSLTIWVDSIIFFILTERRKKKDMWTSVFVFQVLDVPPALPAISPGRIPGIAESWCPRRFWPGAMFCVTDDSCNFAPSSCSLYGCFALSAWWPIVPSSATGTPSRFSNSNCGALDILFLSFVFFNSSTENSHAFYTS